MKFKVWDNRDKCFTDQSEMLQNAEFFIDKNGDLYVCIAGLFDNRSPVKCDPDEYTVVYMDWISVKERLPNTDEYVLGYGKESTLQDLNYEQVRLNSDLCWCSVNNYSHLVVTHWMPLPGNPSLKGIEK